MYTIQYKPLFFVCALELFYDQTNKLMTCREKNAQVTVTFRIEAVGCHEHGIRIQPFYGNSLVELPVIKLDQSEKNRNTVPLKIYNK